MQTKKEKLIEGLEKMEVENDIKIEKLEVKLRTLKYEQDQIVETLEGIRSKKTNAKDEGIPALDVKLNGGYGRSRKRDGDKVTWTARDEEEYYNELKAYREKNRIPMER